MKVDIIGAGIGGLTTAIALSQRGIESRVFEQSGEIKPVGAGIILANNAMQVFDKLGLRQAIEANGNRISSLNITDPFLKQLSSVDLKFFEDKYQVKNIAIHRGKLQQLLAAQLHSDQLHLNKELIGLEASGTSYDLQFSDGSTKSSGLLLGADGIHSVIRKKLFTENKIRNTHQVCWRGLTDHVLPDQYQHELNEAWGKGDRFGFVQIAPGKVYWYALKTFKQNMEEYTINQLEDYFRSYHEVIQTIIQKTPKESIHTAVISDLHPIRKWYRENVCLLGDAAHATTPNMGQGACQAIEDAYVIAACLEKYDLPQAFKEYQRLRMAKAHQVVKTSWMIGKMAHWKNPLARQLRTTLMKATPQSVNRRQSAKLFQLAEV